MKCETRNSKLETLDMPAHAAGRPTDSIQDAITQYTAGLSYGDLPAPVVNAAKALTIDTLGVLIGGFFGEGCRIGRDIAAQMRDPIGATIIGTRMKTTPDMAAFVNGTAARYTDMNDIYTWPGSAHGHPSDCLMAIFAAAEHAGSNGRELITAVVLGYEVFLRISDAFRNHRNFDTTNFAALASAAAACRLYGLGREQIAHGISMAVVPNVILKQVRSGDKSMFKNAATGQACRAGIFAAMLARAGMEGPHLPFEGKAGWCDHVAGGRFSLDTWGGGTTPFKILDSRIKLRPANASAIATILAAERIAPLTADEIERVSVEVHQYAKDGVGSGDWPWRPDTRELADHSIPYLVAATLLDGTINVRSYSEARRNDSRLRALLPSIEVTANEAFTRAYNTLPVQELARITVRLRNGRQIVGESGGDADDLSAPKSDAAISEKFISQTEEYFGTVRSKAVLDRLWHLEDVEDVSLVPPLFTLD